MLSTPFVNVETKAYKNTVATFFENVATVLGIVMPLAQKLKALSGIDAERICSFNQRGSKLLFDHSAFFKN